MITHKPNSLCREAELYYYDFLCDESRGLVPESIFSHTEECQHCQDRIGQLKDVLSQAEGHSGTRDKELSSVIGVLLKPHFAYIGRGVTCETVKPFLPTLSDPDLDIAIPTPITIHLDNCQQCANDLNSIGQLNLSGKQLHQLAQLFAEKPSEHVSCSNAQNVISSVVSMDFSEVDSKLLKHLCTCPACRDLLYKERQKVRDSLSKDSESSGFPCKSVSPGDIFDYAVPFGIAPVSGRYLKSRKSFVSHAPTCPRCLGRMQALHNTVYNILERPESEVVTICNIDESAKFQATGESTDLYSGFPIKVEVINRIDEVETELSFPTIGFGAGLKQKASAMNLKPLVKTAIAAAAVILIAVTLFFSIPTAKAVTIDQVYKAIEKVKNIYISKFVPDQTESVEQKWVSKTLSNYMIKTGKQLVLWDIPNGVRKSKQLDTAVTETIPLTAVSVADVEKKIAGSLGLLPFYDISDVPQDAEWKRVADDGLSATAKGTEVYDLTWTEKQHIGFVVFRRWRVFVDPKTNLPQKTEFYKKLAVDDEFTLETTMIVEYLSDKEIPAVIEESSF
ncbi:MAG: hypothetical protein ACYSXD_09515 [Planctomycetota bacterium]|jgi:hypothetical protein